MDPDPLIRTASARAARMSARDAAGILAWEDMSQEQREREIVKMWRIRRTVLQMMHDRAYLVADKELTMTLAEFRARYVPAGSLEAFSYASLTFTVSHKADPTNQRCVFFNGEPKIGVEMVQRYSAQMKEMSAKWATVIYRGVLSGFGRKDLALHKDIMEIFHEEEVIVNITEHVLVPQHIVLSDEEKQQLLER